MPASLNRGRGSFVRDFELIRTIENACVSDLNSQRCTHDVRVSIPHAPNTATHDEERAMAGAEFLIEQRRG